jgi:hypothetical protein
MATIDSDPTARAQELGEALRVLRKEANLSSYSGTQTNCVEVAFAASSVRDSKDPRGDSLRTSSAALRGLLEALSR